MEILFPFLLSLLLSIGLTKAIILNQKKLAWLIRKPSQDRWHGEPTPSFGGIAMFLAFSITVIVLLKDSGDLWKLLLGGTVVFILGLMDDIYTFPPYVKLIGQITVACAMILLGIHAFLTWNPLIYIPLTVIWMVGITNAFNLLDNMDGLAAGIALIAALFMGVLTFLGGNPLPLGLFSTFMGATVGFLFFNRNPAKIFMGDCGSQWMGFTLATLGILGTWQNASNLLLVLITPILVLAVPIFDTTLVTLNRKIQGRPVSQGGRDHASHRLVALGLSQNKTVSVLWGLSIIFGLIAILAQLYSAEIWLLIVSVAVIFTLVIGLFLTDAKVYHHNVLQKEIFPSILYKRRIVELVSDCLLIGVIYILAYLLRYDWTLNPYFLSQIEKSLPIVVAAKLISFLIFGLYRGLWTYIDFEGFVRLLKVSVLASLTTVLVILGVYRFEGFSRTLFVIDFILLFAAMGGTRALLRALRESIFAFPESGVHLLIVGAGDTCRYLLSEIRKNRQWNLRPVAIVDDDRRKRGKTILDIPIVGTHDEIPEIVQKHHVKQIVIAIPSAKADQLDAIRKSCDESRVPHVTMQSLEDTLIRQIVKDG